MTKRVFNFSAGPAMLPENVLKKAADEMLNYNNCGMSVMELSHRSATYQDIIDRAEASLRKLMNIPENYKVLFLQGGASTQFLTIPLNFAVNKKADYINTGAWSKKAIAEAKKAGVDVKVVADSSDKNFSYFPKLTSDMFRSDADYIHITSNNTIYGTKCMELPKTDIPVIADMSSNILSEEFDITKYAMVYAGAQKNIGPSGVTIVIVREDMVGKIENLPTMLDYATHVKGQSMFNTPPTYGIYIAGLVFDNLLEMGGVKAIEKINREKAALIYNAIDNSEIFKAHVNGDERSLMNIPFFPDSEKVKDTDLCTKKFLAEAAENNLVTLKGHRSVGGMRASVYNAMPFEGCKALAEFITKFDKENR
ncbi:MAG: 3-phosphoserine/phosphohydroxythreonine aminotransferase [Candidatus Cloacimonadota bacterium]|nr:MAG: 3-phosphoserine/phosphohydroxythreonine aminotransferase [Candidatus Cloacimonadota bacterium]PIE78203.1 MAG: 3-phosphoserine/phosphohydroxythreonine aminotransferase [Candidatus Delongbacteria bacterium]